MRALAALRHSLAIDANDADGMRLLALAAIALSKCGLSQADASRLYGVNAGTFSRQLAGQYGHHLSLLRLGKLPSAWRVEFARLLAEDCGLTVVPSMTGRRKRAAREAILELIDIAIGDEDGAELCGQSASGH